jgi:hypothetical protein
MKTERPLRAVAAAEVSVGQSPQVRAIGADGEPALFAFDDYGQAQ